MFSRTAFAWEDLDRERLFVIPPSIDVFTAKNQPLSPRPRRRSWPPQGLAPAASHEAPVFTRSTARPNGSTPAPS